MSSPAVQVRTRLPRVADAAFARARLSVVPRQRTRAARVPFVMLVSLMLVGGVVGLLLFNTSMQQASFAATELENQATVLSAREQGLRMEIEDLRNPQRVAERAQAMGMVIPATSCFLSLSGEVTGCDGGGAEAAPLRLDPPPPVKPAALDPATRYVKAPGNPVADTSSASPDQGHGRGRNGETRHEHREHQKHQQKQP